jgi:hypothetical protein
MCNATQSVEEKIIKKKWLYQPMKLYQQRAKSDVDKNIYYTSLICIAEQAFAIVSLLDHVIICDSMTCEGVLDAANLLEKNHIPILRPILIELGLNS